MIRRFPEPNWKKQVQQAKPCCTTRNLTKWDCGCMFGCGTCYASYECKVCHKKYSAKAAKVLSKTKAAGTP